MRSYPTAILLTLTVLAMTAGLATPTLANVASSRPLVAGELLAVVSDPGIIAKVGSSTKPVPVTIQFTEVSGLDIETEILELVGKTIKTLRCKGKPTLNCSMIVNGKRTAVPSTRSTANFALDINGQNAARYTAAFVVRPPKSSVTIIVAAPKA